MRSLIQKVSKHQVWSKKKSGRENPSKSYPGTFQKIAETGKKKCTNQVRPVPLRPCIQNPQKLLLCHTHLPWNHQCLSYPNLLLFFINVWPVLPVPLSPRLTGTPDGSKDAQPLMLSLSSAALKLPLEESSVSKASQG